MIPNSLRTPARIIASLSASLVLSLSTTLSASAAMLDDAEASVFAKHEIDRVNQSSEVAPNKRGNLSFTFNSSLNIPSGKSYVIVTDQDDPACLSSLDKLAQYHSAQIIKLRDLRNLTKMPAARNFLIKKLQAANPEYVAFAPRIENFSENTLLALWQVLLSEGGGKLNVYPGFLIGRNAQELDALITRCIANQKLSARALKPVVVAQVVDRKEGGMRAFQKADVMEDLFSAIGQNCSGLVVRTPLAPPPLTFPKVGTLGTLNAPAGASLPTLPPNAVQALSDAHLIMLFGHGSPGMSCSISVNAFDDVTMKNDVVLCGSCFSCTPLQSDVMQNSNGKRPDALVYHALANGASVFYGHMHENGGFPMLYIAFEALMKGETVGQSYQRVLNCEFAESKIDPNQFIMTEDQLADKQAVDARNKFLLVMIGDPAASPISSDDK
jgi:hypothetical protein